jgi:hypothetical protein
VPLDALCRPHVMPLRDTFFNFNLKITNTSFPHSMLQSTAVDECDYKFSKAPKISQMLKFFTYDLSEVYVV